MRGLVLKDLDLLAEFAEKGQHFHVSEAVAGSPQRRILDALASVREAAERLSNKVLFVEYLDKKWRHAEPPGHAYFVPRMVLELFQSLKHRGLLTKPNHLSIARRYENLITSENKVDVLKHVAEMKVGAIGRGEVWKPSQPVRSALERQIIASYKGLTYPGGGNNLQAMEETMAQALGIDPARLRVVKTWQLLSILAEREQQLMAMVRNPRVAAVASRKRLEEVLRNPEKHGIRGREANILFKYQLEDLKRQGHLPYELEAAKPVATAKLAKEYERFIARRNSLRRRSRTRSRAK